MKVSVDITGKSLSEALDALFKGTTVGYKIKGDNVILFRVEKKENRSVKTRR